MTPCPTCGKAVDTLRARHVGVRDGKVVAFCSADCEALGLAADARTLAAKATRTRTPPAGVPATRTPPGGLPATLADYDSGPVIEIIHDAASAGLAAKRAIEVSSGGMDSATASGELKSKADPDDPSASSVRRTRRRKDSLDARSAWEWLDEEPAEPLGPEADATEPIHQPRSRSRLVPALLAIALLGGGGYLAYRYIYLPRTAATPATPPPRPEPVAPDAPPLPTPDQQRRAAIERATGVLRGLAKDATPRIQRLAAGALSRTGDPASIAVLAGALEQETSESARLELAYQLARAGDPRGTAKLVASLALQDRDNRLDAAARLARLGDPRAVPVLTAVMAYSQFRLSAAMELAHLADPAAIKALEQIRADPAASADDKARAIIALGRARRADIGELRALLADKRNAEAAPVLAALGDASAKPVLHEQLGFEHIRVEAARSLRRIGNDDDLADGLRTLLAALGADRDTAQIRAAEATLLLAGPASWSERM